MTEKINHTPGEWNFNHHFYSIWVDSDIKDDPIALADVLQSALDGYLMRLAPTAPHLCDVPDCPGPKNLAIIQAAAGLAAAGKIVFSEHKRKAVHGPCICAFCEALAAYNEATI